MRHWLFNKSVAGVDESGRGPLAGPVVGAAVVFAPSSAVFVPKDSKALTPKQREMYFEKINQSVISIGIGIADSNVIERINILQASLAAMAEAVQKLNAPPDIVLVDGNKALPIDIEQNCIVKGDLKCSSIAAASVVAKVTRDRMMYEYDEKYPMYGFRQHKGYPTKQHLEAIRKYGPCPIHRKTFKGVY